ncbi:meiosis-specific kinetochore protein-like isoform X4 [Tamandua tetradactyla]|uniref:meiosis-specific kinetochore protein-like isoform X4 n=1 Tax=Tamandua tetradactyla TaxID=48850 RepID=UPI0040545938
MEHSISSSLLSYSLVDSYTECTSSEESLSNFPSPELFRGSGYLDWECPKLEEHMQCRNSTLLDISRAVAVEKAPQFSNISAIVPLQKSIRNAIGKPNMTSSLTTFPLSAWDMTPRGVDLPGNVGQRS